MNKKNSGKKIKTKREFSSGLIIGISIFYMAFLFFFVRPYIKKNSTKLKAPNEVIYYDSIDGDYLMLKDEFVFSSNKISGTVNYEEGTRLKFGVIKAGVANNDEYHKLSEELANLNYALSIFNSEIIDIDMQLRKYIVDGDYKNMSRIIDTFDYRIGSDKTYSSVEEINQEIVKINERLATISSDEMWNPPGIISYAMDGYEYLKIESLESISKDEFDDLISRNDLSANKLEFKIVDNFKAMLVSYFPDNNQLRELNGKNTMISLDDKATFISAKVVIPETYDKEGLVGFLVTSHVEDIYTLRRGKISIIFSQVPALQIPTESIVQYNDTKGVVVKDVNGIIRFKPISIYMVDEDLTYISKGDDYSRIRIGDEDIGTLLFYEEIILNPDLDKIDTIYR